MDWFDLGQRSDELEQGFLARRAGGDWGKYDHDDDVDQTMYISMNNDKNEPFPHFRFSTSVKIARWDLITVKTLQFLSRR